MLWKEPKRPAVSRANEPLVIWCLQLREKDDPKRAAEFFAYALECWSQTCWVWLEKHIIPCMDE